METHLTQNQGSVLYRRANYSPSGLHICVSFLERTSPDNFLTTIAALSKERMTHLCEEITNIPFHPRQYDGLTGFTDCHRDKRRDCTRMVSRRHAQAKRLRKLFINHTPFSLRRKIPKEVQNYAGQYALFII
ncbi:hypothetical protein OUZ56_006056 [Daphnia magna]|uniref:Uncharacterized protein n=1 Tax=Daphnia magna TaxID=35525 RepID=A0ABQ9YUJ0_9CRUS|nr:hypothetical protein OUZ56_006056 [Daphnia magna]